MSNVPDSVGAPVISPVSSLKLKPAGSPVTIVVLLYGDTEMASMFAFWQTVNPFAGIESVTVGLELTTTVPVSFTEPQVVFMVTK